MMQLLVRGEHKDENHERRQICDEELHVGMNNHFSRDKIMNFLARVAKEPLHRGRIICQIISIRCSFIMNRKLALSSIKR